MTAALILIADHFLTVLGFLLAVTLLARVSRGHQHAGGALAWLLAIVFAPYIGVPLYLLLSGRKLGRRMERKSALYASGASCAWAEGVPRDTERILASGGMPPRREGNSVALHFNGESAYDALLNLIEEAQHSIHIMIFILGRDVVGRRIVEILARKAAEGVEVRLLLDALGCLWTKRGFVQPLRDAGGEVGVFLPVLSIRRKWSANLRNHRKIVVVDGEAAMIGGMNLDGRFMGPAPDPNRFLDAGAFVRGPVVDDVAEVFASDWEFATGHPLPQAARPRRAGRAGAIVQVVASGPDVREDVLHDALLTAMMDARERIWLVTPYFVPDDALLKVLALQARTGRDVRIVLPAVSNHRIADFARGPAVRQLTRAGARIYAYRHKMVHAKVLVFDDTLAITGSPNLDMRSMYLNFEIALFHYSAPEIMRIISWIDGLASDSEILGTAPPGVVREWVEGLSAMASPLL